MNALLLLLIFGVCYDAAAIMPFSTTPRSHQEDNDDTLARLLQQDLQRAKQALEEIDRLKAQSSQHNSRSSYLHAATGAASVGGILAWLQYAKPGDVARSVHTRFVTGAEIPVAVGLAKVFLGPVVALIACYYVYYKIKSAIADPYQRQNKEMADEFKKLLLDHKIALNDELKKREEKVQRDTSQMRINLVEIQQQMEKVLKEDHEANDRKHQALLKEYAELKAKLLRSNDGLKAELESLEENIKKVGKINKELNVKSNEAVERLEKLHDDMKMYNKHRDRDVKIIESHTDALRTARKLIQDHIELVKQELAKKKDKK